jgi:pyruvate dehydrogenase E2 component (dihydrolipoamide acetyltransferase)
MAIEIKVPRLGWSMEEGTFVEWLKHDGQPVRAGEPLFAIEGDKSIQEVESIGTGILRISPKAPENGETVKVGTTLAFLAGPDETVAFDSVFETTAVSPAASEAAVEPDAASSGSAALPAERNRPLESAGRSVEPAASVLTERGRNERSSVSEPPLNASRAKRPRISPRAARVAAELGIDWKTIQGSGRSGRIRERDVQTEASRQQAVGRRGRAAAEPAEVGAEPVARTSFRRTIAARMVEGAQWTAPVTLTTTADATNLVSLRRQFKAAVKSPDEIVPSYMDIMARLAARALQEHPPLNRQWIDGQILSPNGIHIAVAVDTPAGLVAPVVCDVPSLGLREIAARTHDLKARAHASQLKPQELTGGTFTISNLGAFGIDAFTPIINVPQCAILGLGRIERRPAVVGDQIVPRDMITLSLTFDHRIVDGAPAAHFLATLRNAIENPGPWLVF